MNEAQTSAAPVSNSTAKVVYILYIIGIFFGITGLIGVIMAYVNKSDSPDWLASHYQFQIRTFWIGFLYLFIGSLLSLVVIGWFIILFWVVWLVIRCIKGMKSLDANQPHPDPTTWMF
ncbi:hypothetical protein E5672_11055 [Alteromonas portus]|uniref:DUF4870 domain-containing protein n=1 Tax=Alteromonas portus TaxID=2565549 RepID=A0A4U0ZHT9_9ALTE|nr:hypothetical protein [Alteromonas portus]TKB03565.1 hypothetical protein E5672_11055 [Alteromonas portus]